MAMYLNFQQISITDKLKDQFISEANGMNLGTIIKTSKNIIYPIFHQAIELKNVYLVMIVSSNDNVLIKMANECGFPRGFPVIWIPDIYMQYFGFYPKFSNDSRQLVDNNYIEFDNVISLTFFKKWSGFLTQVLSFVINGKTYWTITSKNSANYQSKFIIDAKRLIKPLMTINVIEVMIKKQLHFCAEIISKNDQVHGSAVITESPIITSIGKGKIYDLFQQYNKILDGDNKFVDFYSNDEIIKICNDYNLPCDSSVSINNPDTAKLFIKELSQRRDFMTDTDLELLIQKFINNGLIINKGTISHLDVSGECLEGLVIKMTDANGIVNTKKYKFANYIVRTILLREQFNKFCFGYDLVTQTKKFVELWCVSETGKKYWYDFALQCFLNFRNYTSTDPLIASHIQIADMVSRQTSLETTQEEFNNALSSLTNSTIIICIGPIGSGKSTFANELASKDPIFEAIDGDKLDFGIAITMKLGKERNDYTRWKVIEALMMGKIPVISTSGGVLFSMGQNQKFILNNQITSTLGIACKIIVCISSNLTKITALDKTHNVDTIYNNTTPVKNTVTRRINFGEWTIDSKFKTGKTTEKAALDNFTTFIVKKSVENAKFAKQLIAAADVVFGYPLITEENYGIEKNFNFDEIIASVIIGKKNGNGKFSQIRLLCQIDNDTIGHITWKFDPGNNIVFDLNNFTELASMYPTTVNGSYQKIISIDNRAKYTFVTPEYSIHDDGSTHITIDCGNHAPKETGSIVRMIICKQQFIDLREKNNKIIRYDLSKVESNPCTIKILAAFGI